MGRLNMDDRPDAAASSHSLHSLDEDLPPPYTDEPDHIPTITQTPAPRAVRPLSLVDSAYALPDSHNKPDDKRAVTAAPALSRNSDELIYVIRRQVRLPPRPLLYVHGTHTETSQDGKRNNSNTVTDFSFKLDLAETMLTGWESGPQSRRLTENWVEVEVLNDEDHKPAFRGGRLRTRTYKARASRGKYDRAEASEALLGSDTAAEAEGVEENTATAGVDANLKMWCDRFCDDPSPVKSYGHMPPPVTKATIVLI